MPNPFADRNGVSGGVQAGYNYQIGPAVLGAEIEGSYLGGAQHKVEGGKVEEKWRGAAKAKAGLSFDQTLLYATAGVALTKFDKGDNLRGSDGWKPGYLAGAGIEQAFCRWSLRQVEYN